MDEPAQARLRRRGPRRCRGRLGLPHPQLRRRGIGRALAEHVLAAAKAAGYRAMVFNSVVETNPAVRLWTSLGFTVLGTVPEAFDHPRHGRVGLHIMYKSLL